MAVLAEIASAILLFFLVYGMSATVEISHLLVQVRNVRALLIGLGMQFVILPFIGFLCIRAFQLPAPVGITLMVVTSSPGGSYSNWWCSVFNAELALSVTMTAISTILSTIMLPLNLLLYSKWTYSAAVVEHLDWDALFVSICVVIGGITAGLITSAYGNRTGQSIVYHRNANRLGNIAGISLIALSIIVSIVANNNNQKDDDDSNNTGGTATEQSTNGGAMWNQDWTFYVGCALPVILGLNIATYLTRKAKLEKPERVAAVIESCYQNTGIATSVALSMFSGKVSTSTNIEASLDDTSFLGNNTNITDTGVNSNFENVTPINFGGQDNLAMALGVPLYYGLVEAVSLAIFCIICWKMSWTKAPADESICTILTTSYEVKECEHRLHNEQQEDTAIEVVWDSNTASTSTNTNNQHNNDRDDNEGGSTQSNLIFSRSGNGQYVVDSNTLNHVHQHQKQEKDNQPNVNMRRRSDSSTEITMVDDEDCSGGESCSSTGNNSDGKEEGKNNNNHSSRQYSPKRIWKKLVTTGLSSNITSSDIEATINSQQAAEGSDTENLSTTSHSDGPQTSMGEDDESEFPIQQQINSTRLQRTISRVRARAAGYKQQLAITTSSSDDSAIVTTTNQTVKHTRKVVRGGRIIRVEAKLGADDFDDDNDDSSCTDDDYDIEDNEHDDVDDDDDQHHHHHGKFRRRRQPRYHTVETRSPSELIQRQEAEERNNIGFTTSTAEPTRID